MQQILVWNEKFQHAPSTQKPVLHRDELSCTTHSRSTKLGIEGKKLLVSRCHYEQLTKVDFFADEFENAKVLCQGLVLDIYSASSGIGNLSLLSHYGEYEFGFEI